MSDEQVYHRIKNLITGLIIRTESEHEEDRIDWEAVDEDSFELSLSRSSIRLGTQDGDAAYPFRLSILDDEGRVVETVYAHNSEFDDYRLGELYSAASRSHRQVNERLTELFDELGIADPPPPPPATDPWGPSPEEPPF